jgi:hypothetical protein
MTYNIYCYSNKIPYLVAELGDDKVKVVGESDDPEIVKVAITIENSWDIQALLAAGVRIGVNVYAIRPA